MTPTSFDILKKTCTDACHERHACTEGYKQMLASKNVSQMMATWRDNINDITTEKFADIANEALPALYADNKEEMNKSGVYVNECPENAHLFVLVFITDSASTIHIFGEATAYVLGKAEVQAHDHSRVYNNKCDDAVITALDYSFVSVTHGTVKARMRSTAHIGNKAICHCYNSTKVYSKGGEIHDHGHYYLEKL